MYPKITIVTPSYNQASFIEQTILSVLSQGYPNLEYIIMDGGSNDGSVDIIKKYSNKLAYWKSEKDKGQSDAIQKGFDMATGDIIGWLNSDDFLEENSLWKIAEIFRGNPELKIISGGVKIFQNGVSDGVVQYKRPSINLLRYNGNTFFQASTFWKRDFYNNCGLFINERLHYVMDYELWLRMSFCISANELLFVDDHFSNLNYHEAQKITDKNFRDIAKEGSAVRMSILAKNNLLFKAFLFLIGERLKRKPLLRKIPSKKDVEPLLYWLKLR